MYVPKIEFVTIGTAVMIDADTGEVFLTGIVIPVLVPQPVIVDEPTEDKDKPEYELIASGTFFVPEA